MVNGKPLNTTKSAGNVRFQSTGTFHDYLSDRRAPEQRQLARSRYQGPAPAPARAGACLARRAATARFYRQDAFPAPDPPRLGANLTQLRTTLQRQQEKQLTQRAARLG